MKSDILARLRITWCSDDYGVSKEEMCNERNNEAMTAAQEIERLRADRDNARREVCELKAFNYVTITAHRYADLRKWDCFKGETP
jgi:hypothetical protein